MLVYVATSRPVGARCIEWARGHLPKACELTDHPEESDVFISVMYDTLVDERFIHGRRCYNFHPGILPQYRGSGAFSWAIINGDRETGVTLHELDVDIDHGPIIAWHSFPVHPTDTAESLFNTAMEVMEGMFKGWFDRLLDGRAVGQPQDEKQARTYYRRDLQKARDLTRFVRASAFQDKPPAYYLDSDGNEHEVLW